MDSGGQDVGVNPWMGGQGDWRRSPWRGGGSVTAEGTILYTGIGRFLCPPTVDQALNLNF